MVTTFSVPSARMVSASRLAGLDALRAVAILHVVFSHGAMDLAPDMQGPLGKIKWLMIATNFGVPLFFVLSGFLITRQLAGGMPIRTFYWHRFAKIYPTYLLAVLVFGLLARVDEADVWLQHILAFHNTSVVLSSRMSGHLWSLAVEIQFYLLAPVLFAFGFRWLSPLGLALVGVLSFFGHLAYLLHTVPTHAERLLSALNVYQSSSFNFLALCLGGLLFRAHIENRSWRWAPMIGLAATVAMPLICAVFVPSLRIDQANLSHPLSLMALLMLIAAPPLASVCLAFWILRSGWFNNKAAASVVGFVSAISYQWYLWHPLVLNGINAQLGQSPQLNAWIIEWPVFAMGMYFVASAMLAWAAYSMAERPIHRWLLARSKE